MNVIRKFLLWLADGVPKQDHNRLQAQYQALMDSKTDHNCVQLCNEYIYRIIDQIDKYMQSLYKTEANIWCDKVFNYIRNNKYRIMIQYIHTKCCSIYRMDETLVEKGQLIESLKDDQSIQDFFILETD